MGVNFSLYMLFWQADWIVKSVMLALIAASIFVWVLALSHYFFLKRLDKMADSLEESFEETRDLELWAQRLGREAKEPFSALFLALWSVIHENEVFAHTYCERLLENADTRMRQQENTFLSPILGTLASIGTSAPFIGLFGTVWGIMHSFQGIASTGNTSLAVVAPALAEALFATALGLIVAIPANLAYNKLAQMTGIYEERLEVWGQTVIARILVMLARRRGR